MTARHSLSKGLKGRHIRFMALGSAIGTGLFYGSAEAINMAGPSVIVAYLIGGVAAWIIMRALGELAVNDPQSGAFSRYAHHYLGPLYGFMTGWTWCFEILIVAIADVTAFGIYMGVWFPDVPQWIWVLSVVLLIGALNLLSVKVFGEIEFWLSLVKVITILLMIAVGIGLIVWGIGNGGRPTGIANLWQHGGFFAHGVMGMILSLQVVMFAYGGIEIIGVTAGEARDPATSIPQAINAVPLRILLFYAGTLFVIMAIYPWNAVGQQGSPFVLTFERLGIASAATVLNLVVISASISAVNSDVFGVGRMLQAMADQGDAPRVFQRLSSRGIPWAATLAMVVAMLLAVLLNWMMPKKIFLIIASLATFATVWVWLMILLAHIAFRRERGRERHPPTGYPLPGGMPVAALGVVFLLFILALLAWFPDTRIALYVGGGWIAWLVLVWQRWRRCR
ncbi:proline-specific permease ProY [Pantoea sp. 1.19]|uniref:proline-specific permease ProY n=1 Tax=Pantoea sp. 1.19 TaxID=1925589 RepID=UPI000948BEB1|nr:proline-specific permease ProY [Pantoea sp. 1.19]